MALLISDPVDWRRDLTTQDLVVPIEYVSGVEGVAQGVDGAIRLVLGEWAFDLAAGVPWLANSVTAEGAAILANPFDEQLTRARLRTAILKVPGVGVIDALGVTFDSASRAASVTFTVGTIWGLPVEGAVEVTL